MEKAKIDQSGWMGSFLDPSVVGYRFHHAGINFKLKSITYTVVRRFVIIGVARYVKSFY